MTTVNQKSRQRRALALVDARIAHWMSPNPDHSRCRNFTSAEAKLAQARSERADLVRGGVSL